MRERTALIDVARVLAVYGSCLVGVATLRRHYAQQHSAPTGGSLWKTAKNGFELRI